MKACFLYCLVFFSTSLCAYYSGAPTEPEQIEKGLLLGEELLFPAEIFYLRDTVFGESFKKTRQGKIANFFMETNQGGFSLSFMDKMEASFFAGASVVTGRLATGMVSLVDFTTKPGFSWALGGRVLPLQVDAWCFGVEGKVFKMKGEIATLGKNGVRLFDYKEGSLSYTGWQVVPSWGFLGKFLSPYVGVKFGRGELSLRGLSPLAVKEDSLRAISKHFVGLVIGAVLSNAEYFSLTFESRMVDESALSSSLLVKF